MVNNIQTYITINYILFYKLLYFFIKIIHHDKFFVIILNKLFMKLLLRIYFDLDFILSIQFLNLNQKENKF